MHLLAFDTRAHEKNSACVQRARQANADRAEGHTRLIVNSKKKMPRLNPSCHPALATARCIVIISATPFQDTLDFCVALGIQFEVDSTACPGVGSFLALLDGSCFHICRAGGTQGVSSFWKGLPCLDQAELPKISAA